MKILVTGGAGFIGSSLIRSLINQTEHNVICVDSLTYAGSLSSLHSISLSRRFSFKNIDICDVKSISAIFNDFKPDIVMHLAAESHVDRSIDSPANFIQTNIFGTYVLLEESLKYWRALSKENKLNFRFHHISTDEVYGDLQHPDNIIDSDKLPLFNEESPYKPSSPYSASKASSDHLVRAWYKTYGLPILITNCSNNYGPFQYPEKLIPLTILNAINKMTIPVYGLGNQIRDWLYVTDHTKALIEVAIKGKVGQTYNIGGHNEIRNIDVVKTICTILDELKPTDTKYEELIEHVMDRPGHDMRYAIDSSKIQNDLGWYPKETFESGIRKTIVWYLENLDWCKRIKDKI